MGRSRMRGEAERRFWAFGCGYNKGAVIQQLPDNFPPLFEFYEGTPLASRIKQKGTTSFSKGFRTDVKVFDSVTNDMKIPIVSERIKAIVEGLGSDDCEFIPVVLLDHKRKVASTSHYLLNTLRLIDFVDMNRSRYELSDLDPGEIAWLKELHIQPAKVDQGVHVFRATTLRGQVFVDEEICQAFEKEKITGLRLFPAEGWNGDTM